MHTFPASVWARRLPLRTFPASVRGAGLRVHIFPASVRQWRAFFAQQAYISRTLTPKVRSRAQLPHTLAPKVRSRAQLAHTQAPKVRRNQAQLLKKERGEPPR